MGVSWHERQVVSFCIFDATMFWIPALRFMKYSKYSSCEWLVPVLWFMSSMPYYPFLLRFSLISLQERSPFLLACVAGGSGYPRELRSRTRVQKAAQVARRMGWTPENSLTGVAREGVSGFAAKSFARAPTPASYAGYPKSRGHWLISKNFFQQTLNWCFAFLDGYGLRLAALRTL